MSKSLKMFITYAHKNSKAKDKLITYLAVLKQNGLIDVWHDNEILPGDKWQDEIFNNLADSDILLYLTCPYSLASESCNKELTAQLNPNIRVIPIILEYCDWQNHQLSDFQALPEKGKPIYDISEWNPESKGWMSVVEGIRKVVNEMQSQAKPSPSITPEEIETLAFLAFHRGNFLLMLKQIDEALKAYSRAIELSPNNAKAYNNRGVAYRKKGKLDLAVKDYTKAIKLNPDDANAYSNRGNVYREKGEFNRAIDDTNTAIELNPNCTEAYNNRGAAYGAKGDVDHAIKDCSKAIALNLNCTEAYSNRSNAYLKKGQVDRAIDDCNTALQIDPDYVEAYVNRGNAYLQKYEIGHAIENYTTAIRFNPRFTEAYFNRGTAYCQKGEFGLAIEDYNEAIQINPSFVRAYYCRAFVWLHFQKWDKARTDLTLAQEKGVDIIVLFYQLYGSVINFEQKTGIQLPEDIAAMLTPPQA